MDALVIGLGSAGDVHPMIGLALALRRRGHGVRLAAAEVFRPLADRSGIDFLGIGEENDYYDALRDPHLWDPFRAFPVVCRRLLLPLMRPVYEIVARHRPGGAFAVVAPATAFGARIANEAHGIPLATAHLQPALIRSVYEPVNYGFPDIVGRLPRKLRRLYLHAADRLIIDRILAPEVNRFRAELGLPPVRRLFERWIHSPGLVLGFFPEWFAAPQPDWPANVYLTGFPLYDESDLREPPAALAQFLQTGEPPVVFAAGSANVQAREFFRVSADVCRASGRRGILLTQFRESLPPELPACVRHFEYLPFSRVLPRAAALVHHGGIGTVAQALAAGIPQLVVPNAHDQPDNAVRVRRLGVGDMLLPKDYTAAAAGRMLSRLLESDSVRRNCLLRARDMAAANPIESACALLERMACGRQS
jgi:rhamnosyltransferase subunit B